jgi:catechol 2,3-dioxygenase-like lactoylglutathione lyase family enzyme
MNLDHVTLVSNDVEPLHRFFRDVAGLAEGPRPAFGVRGHWLYLNEHPLVHLIEAEVSPQPVEPASRIDHVALRVEGSDEWHSLLQRLRQTDLHFGLGEGAGGELQLFVEPLPGITIEFIFRPPGRRQHRS